MDTIQKDIENLSLEKPYKRMLLIQLTEEKSKGIYTTEKCSSIIKEIQLTILFKTSNLDYLSFYYYNSESIEDYGWGCAWRAIQTSLSFYKNYFKEKNTELNQYDISFNNLFMSFGKRDTLEKLYIKEYNTDNNIEIPDYLKTKEFAPYETNNGWAEPFIGKLIFSHFNIKGELFLINQWPTYAFAPEQVFNRCVTFTDFITILTEHFDHKTSSGPLIIDDSVCSLCIIGIYSNKETKLHHLLLMDPHVKLIDKGDTGIYQVILTETGEFKAENNPQPTILGKRLDFSQRGWMVFKLNTI